MLCAMEVKWFGCSGFQIVPPGRENVLAGILADNVGVLNTDSVMQGTDQHATTHSHTHTQTHAALSVCKRPKVPTP